ncbi:MAG: hypothetical protein O2887_14940 [Bacteroidetes bacterium]|nr:hypothetical protein [Bacteroidota bacterium]MDA1121761.1 hypothetical protein [Bacteroidota bacterium]
MERAAQLILLKKQLDKINDPGFDLEAWKANSATLFSRIFGKEDERIQAINDLKIDYSSWALRDASAKYNPLATCKIKALGIMEMSIQELEMETTSQTDVLNEIFSQHLTGKQLKEIREILSSKSTEQEKEQQLAKKLLILKAPVLSELLADVLLKNLK